jgi:AcrR family transcriptional regulator
MLPWSPPAEPSTPSGRRERKKSRTRDDLIAAATELFATHGYDSTTIEQITELADVSPRTFFRHFASKEDVLFPTEFPTDSLMAALARQPDESNDLQAIRDAYVDMLPLDEAAMRRTIQLKKAVRSNRALEGRDLALQRQFRDHLALAVARRHGLEAPDELAELVAALAQAIIHLAFDRWAEADGKGDLDLILQRHFDLADRIVTPPSSRIDRQRVLRKAKRTAP